MDRKDLQFEELHVPEPVRLAFHRLDLVVRPLHRAACDQHVVVRQQPRTVPLANVLAICWSILIPDAFARRIQPSRNMVANALPGWSQNRRRSSFK